MASVNTTDILNGILNCVTRIEKTVTGGAGGSGGSDSSSATKTASGSIKAKISDLKGMGKEIGTIATGLIKMRIARPGLKVFNQFLNDTLFYINRFSTKETVQAIGNLAYFIDATTHLSVTKVIAFRMFVNAIDLATKGKSENDSPFGKLGSILVKKWSNKRMPDGLSNFKKFLTIVDRHITVKNVAALALFDLIAIPTALALSTVALSAMAWGDRKVYAGTKAMKYFGKGIKDLSVGIALFALTIFASSAVLQSTGIKPSAGFGVVGAALSVIALTTLLFGTRPVRRGAYAMKDLGKGFLSLSSGIAILALTIALGSVMMKDTSLGALGMGVTGVLGAVVAIAGITFLFGASKEMREGAKAIKGVGVGMIALAAGVAILGLAFVGISALAGENFASTVLSMVLSTVALAGMVYFMGKKKKEILFGALTMAAMSLGLIVFGFALKTTFEVLPKKDGRPDWEMMGFVAATIAAIATEMGIIGVPVVAGFVATGALTTAAMGVGLISLAHGISKWNESGVDNFDTKKFDEVTESLRTTYNKFGLLESGKLAIASGAITAIGLSLSALAWGVGKWANLQNLPLIQGYKEDGTPIYGSEKVDISKAIQNVKDILNLTSDVSVIKPFKDLADSGVLTRASRGGLGGLLGMQADSPFEIGIKASMGIGSVLTSMAKGIGSFAQLQNIPLVERYTKDGSPVFGGKTVNIDTAIQNIADVLSPDSASSVLKPFIDLASHTTALKQGSRGFSLLGAIGIKADSPFEVGIKASAGIGEVLSSIAEGIGAFAQLQNIPLVDRYDKNGKPIYSGKKVDITTAIAHIKEVFDIGGTNSVLVPFIDLASNVPALTQGSRGFSLLGAIGIKADSPFEVGIKAATGIGNVLTSIGKGLMTFAQLEAVPIADKYDSEGNPIYSGKTVNVMNSFTNIGTVLTSLVDTFATFANTHAQVLMQEGRGLSLLGAIGIKADSPFEVGIKASTGIGEVLNGIGTGLMTFAQLESVPVADKYDEQGKPVYSGKTVNVLSTFNNIKTVLNKMVDIFADFSDNKNLKKVKSKKIEEVTDRFKFITDTLSDFAKTHQNVEKTATAVGNLAKGMNEFGTAINLVSDEKWEILRDLSVSLKDATSPERVGSLLDALSSLTNAVSGATQNSDTSSEAVTAVSENTSDKTAEATKTTKEKTTEKSGGNMSELITEIKSLKSEISSIKRALTTGTLNVKTVTGSVISTE